MEKNVSQLRLEVNRILAEWNPIGVDPDIALDEYKGYIPKVLKAMHSESSLMNCLEDILLNDIGLEYDLSNEMHVKDLQNVCRKLLSI